MVISMIPCFEEKKVLNKKELKRHDKQYEGTLPYQSPAHV